MNDSSSRPLQVGYLVVGLVFLGIAGSWALRAGGVVDTGQVQWLIPLVLVTAGLVGLVAFGARNLRRGRSRPEVEPYADPADDPDDLPSDLPSDVHGDLPDDTEPTLPLERDH